MATVDFGRYKRMVEHFWDPIPKNDDLSASKIWCLGKNYDAIVESHTPATGESQTASVLGQELGQEVDRETVMVSADHLDPKDIRSCSPNGGVMSPETHREGENDWPSDFLDDFESRFWFTYRSHFPTIKQSDDPKASSAMTLAVRLRSQLVDHGGFTSDTGWGCMIRSGQCVLANAMAKLDLGRDWKRGTNRETERRLLSQFADDPRAAYSIHKFVQHGAQACGTYPGQWFGPSATARCIKALTEEDPSSKLKVYNTGDGADVYEDAIFQLAGASSDSFTPVLILVGTRLGIRGVTKVYWEALKAALQLPQSVGIAGGRPSSSHYFVGVQGDRFYYLDPHQSQPALPLHDDVDAYTTEEVDSCHTRRLRRLHIKDMDPSMLIAFLIQDMADWRAWRAAIEETSTHGKGIVRVSDAEVATSGQGSERVGAVDEVESFDEEENDDGDDDEEGDLVSLPSRIE